MIAVEYRIGRFTSSQISRLIDFGTRDMTESEKEELKKINPKSQKRIIEDISIFGSKALTYIEEKECERCLGRSIDTGAYSQEMTWGKIWEAYVFEFVLGMEYSLCSKQTEVHPKYPFWAGSPDFKKTEVAGEMKCYYPKKFFLLSKALLQLIDGIISLDDFKSKFGAEYWQVVSNSCILNVPKCELLIFTPTKAQLDHIFKIMDGEEKGYEGWFERIGLDPWMYRFLDESRDGYYKLPHIPEHSNWPNMVKYEFTPPKEDLKLLEFVVCNAEKTLTSTK
jgi:hypothetical protein